MAKIDETAERLARLARQIAWNPRSGIFDATRRKLRAAVEAFEKAKAHPTAFDHILSDDDLFERETNVAKCAYLPCSAPMSSNRHGRRKYHSEECRKKAFLEREKAGLVVRRKKKGR